MLTYIMIARHDLHPSKMHSSPTDVCKNAFKSNRTMTILPSSIFYFLCNLDFSLKYKIQKQFTSINPRTKRQPCSLPAPHSLFSSSSPFASRVCSWTCTVAYLLPLWLTVSPLVPLKELLLKTEVNLPLYWPPCPSVRPSLTNSLLD